MASVTGKKINHKAIARGKAKHASLEALNGGGFKTTVHHHPAKPTGHEWEPQPAPLETAHKNYNAARRHLDEAVLRRAGRLMITQEQAEREPFVDFDAGNIASSHSLFNIAFLTPALAVLGNATESALTMEDVNIFRLSNGLYRVQRRLAKIIQKPQTIRLWQDGTIATHDPEPECSRVGPHSVHECGLLLREM